MKFFLKIIGPDNKSHTRTFDDDQVTIGSHPMNVLVLKDAEVSRYHAIIERRGTGYFLSDRRSTNGTELNGAPIEPDHDIGLQPNSVIGIGPFSLTFECPDLAALDQTIPHVDTNGAAKRLDQALEQAFADAYAGDPRRRAEALRSALEQFLAPHDDAVKLEILGRFSAPHADTDVATPEIRSSDAAPRSEELYVASRVAMDRLAKLLLGREPRNAKEVERFGKRVEMVMEVVFEWLPKLFAVREGQKESFSVDLTNLQPQVPNPAKHRLARDTEEMRKELLDTKREKDTQVVRDRLIDAFKGLVEHQAALMRGMEQCVRDTLDRVSPEAVQQAASVHRRPLLWLSEKSILWRKFVTLYDRMVGEGMTEHVMYEAFRRGYLDAVRNQRKAEG